MPSVIRLSCVTILSQSLAKALRISARQLIPNQLAVVIGRRQAFGDRFSLAYPLRITPRLMELRARACSLMLADVFCWQFASVSIAQGKLVPASLYCLILLQVGSKR
jgi:hypothetical protein